jgi:hypothetical protein
MTARVLPRICLIVQQIDLLIRDRYAVIRTNRSNFTCTAATSLAPLEPAYALQRKFGLVVGECVHRPESAGGDRPYERRLVRLVIPALDAQLKVLLRRKANGHCAVLEFCGVPVTNPSLSFRYSARTEMRH